MKRKIQDREEVYCDYYWAWVPTAVCVKGCPHYKGYYSATGYVDCDYEDDTI